MKTSPAYTHRSIQSSYNNPSQLPRKAAMLALMLFSLLMMSAIASAQVSVTATAGTVGPTPYTTLGGAFTAINAGTHQGAITIDIQANTTEAGASFLNSGDAAPASYTSVLIRPTADGVTISGPTVIGRGLIELNGADNVTIDGDNPNTGGTNRNLTITNTAAATINLASIIRLAVLPATVVSANNVTIMNLNLNGNATGRNGATFTSTTNSENSSFGIYAGGLATGPTTAPGPLTSVSTNTATAGTTMNAFNATNNAVNACARAIFFNGAASSVSTGVTISNNLVGDQSALAGAPPFTTPATTVYTKGIFVAGTTAVTISGNSVRNIISYVVTAINAIELNSAIGAGTISISNNTVNGVCSNSVAGTSSERGIIVSNAGGPYSVSGNTVTNVQQVTTSFTPKPGGIEVNTAAASGTVELNRVSTIYNRSTGTGGSYGINLAGGSNVTVRNNFVWDINQDMTGGAAFSTTFAVLGIRINSGTGHKIYHNSINLFGTQFGTAASSLLTAAFSINTTALTGIDVRNNIFSNILTGGTTSIAHVSIFLPTNSATAMGLTLNNNDYFSGADAARQGIAQAGTTAGTGFYLGSNFNAALTTPATNLRALTTVLGTATNDNASQVVDPQFLSSTDLHIAVASPMVNAGDATVGVTTDIDNQTRVGIPDIGADEPSGITPPANDVAANAFVVPTNGTTLVNGSSTTPQASFSNVGTATQTSIGVQFNISGPGGYTYTDNKVIASLASSATTTVTFAAAPVFTTPGSYTMSAAVTTPDANSANDVINGGFTVSNPLAGSYNVPGDFPSLTNNGGIFQAINTVGATSNLTINIASDLVGETGTNALNEIAGGFTVTIKPSGAARTITGSSAISLIKLSGVDNVTIDGSLAGGTDRSLTLNNTGAGAIVWIATNATSGANSDTVKNCIMTGPGVFTGQGFIAGSGTTFGNAAEFPQSNNTIQNNAVSGVQNAAFISGAATLDQNWIVTGNNFGSATVANKLSFRGMIIINGQNVTISNNTISGVNSSTGTSSTMSGIQLAGVINGGTISRNTISDIKQNNTSGWGSNGIYLTASSTGSNLTIVNNFVSDVASQGFNGVTSADNGYGIMIDTGGGYNIWHNTVNLNTNQGAGAASGITAAINIASAVATASSIDLRDNVLADTQTLGTRYGAYNSSTAAIFTDINYNDYFAQNVGFLTAAQATLANWQTATGKDANSKAVDPIFVSSTDLHLQPTSTLLSQGTSPALVANDVDNDPRPTIPDIGADELVQATGGSFAAGTYYNVSAAAGDSLGGNVTVTNALYLNGILNAGANTLTIDCNGTVSGASPTSYITGNLKKNYCSAGVKGFEVGTANGYSPVSVNATAGTFPSNFTVKAVQGPQPNVNAATSLQRYWTLTEGGDITANLNFNYNDPLDIAGTEANYHIIRVVGGTSVAFPNNCPTPGANQACVDFAGNQATVNGVTNFSDWTLGTVSAPTATNGNVSGQIVDINGNPIAGTAVRMTGSQNRLTITDAAGNYHFDDVETNGVYTVTPAHANFTFSPSLRSFSQLGVHTEAAFTGTFNGGGSNSVDSTEYFVRQQYLDFLGREPDEAGFNFWVNNIESCGSNLDCRAVKRIDTSAAFFLSIEFKETGYLVDRMYKTAYGNIAGTPVPLTLSEFQPDSKKLSDGVIVNQLGWQQKLDANKQAFASEFVQRGRFAVAYPETMTPDQFVDRLFANAGVTPSDTERALVMAEFGAAVTSADAAARGRALRRVAENSTLEQQEFNRAFVLMQYFGYLRRDPNARPDGDFAGYNFWLDKLDSFQGDFRNAEMVKAFLVSGEYRQRFLR